MVAGKTGCGAGWDWKKVGLARRMHLRSDRKVKGEAVKSLGFSCGQPGMVLNGKYRRHMGRD